MTDLTRAAALLLVSSLVLVAFFVTLAALFPERLQRCRSQAARVPGRAFLLGLVNGVFVAAIILALLAVADWTGVQLLALPALLLLALLAGAASLGAGGVVQLVGERLLPERGPVLRQAAGALSVALACATPYLGWFGLLPYITLLGLGSFILSFFDPNPRA
jgi:hypothetical protein